MIAQTGDIHQILRQHFPHIAEKGLQDAIAEVGKIMHFTAGEVIMNYGSYIKLIPLIIKGSIKVMREDENDNEVFLYYLNVGQTCSMSFTCCMMHKQSIIRTVAEEDTTLISIPVKYMDIWMSKYQNWKNFVMRSYDDRFDELLKTIDSIAFQKMDERLLDYLHKKAVVTNSSIFNITHQDIAYDLNASREAISRLLKQLEKNGEVKLGRNQIQLMA